VFAWVITIDSPAARAAEHPLISEIRAAWEERQERYQSFEVEWEERRTTPAGGHYRGYPPEEVTHSLRYRLAGDGERLRLTRSGLEYDIDLRRFAEKNYTFVFDGSESRTLWTSEKLRRHPPGFISQGMAFATNNYHVQAVIVRFRPLVKTLSGIDLSTCEIANERDVIDGVPCRLLRGRPKPRLEELYWIATDGDWRILRYERTVNGRVFSQLTIGYEQRAEHGNIPRDWKHVSINDRSGTLSETIDSTLIHSDINRPLPDEEFELEFPPGAVVQGPERNAIAVVRTDGTLRPITQEELAAGTSYAELMRSPPRSK
jgi:hypothetical protein